MKPLLFLLALFALFFAAVYLQAQTTGTLCGRVTDTAGTGIPGARIEIVGTSRGAVSKPSGDFLIAGLRPGTYRVRVAAYGRTFQDTTVSISTGISTDLDILLHASSGASDSIILTDYRRTEPVQATPSICGVPDTGGTLSPALPSVDSSYNAASPDSVQTARSILNRIGRNASVNTTGGGLGIRSCRGDVSIRREGVEIERIPLGETAKKEDASPGLE